MSRVRFPVNSPPPGDFQFIEWRLKVSNEFFVVHQPGLEFMMSALKSKALTSEPSWELKEICTEAYLPWIEQTRSPFVALPVFC